MAAWTTHRPWERALTVLSAFALLMTMMSTGVLAGEAERASDGAATPGKLDKPFNDVGLVFVEDTGTFVDAAGMPVSTPFDGFEGADIASHAVGLVGLSKKQAKQAGSCPAATIS